jgi:hypothetical protein
MEFKESTLPCYPKGIAYETDKYRVVFYEYSTSWGIISKRSHWRAYTIPDGHHVDGEKEYNTKESAIKACEINEGD